MAEVLTGQSVLSQIELLKHQIGVLLKGKTEGSLTIAITSCVAGEGVTTTASNLAASFAQDSDVEVLLIDGNSECRGLERCLKQGKLPGVPRMPEDSCPTTWPLTRLDENLHVLSASKSKRRIEIDTFFSGVNGALDRAKEKYRVVILDCPPIPKMYSSLHLFEKVDGVIVVIEAERVRSEVIENNLTILKDAGADILGCVLNKRRFPVPKFIYRRL